jgi:glycine betaine/proline transport system ATP-binding protein
MGVVPRVTLLAALGNVTTDTGELPIIDPPLTVSTDLITDALATPETTPEKEVAR